MAGMGVTTCTHSVVLRHAEILLSGYGDSPGIPNNNKLLEYCSLMKERQWAEHHTNLPKRGVGALLSISAFNHERVPMSCSQLLDTLKATNSNVQQNHQRIPSQVLTTHNTQWHEDGVARSAHHIRYVRLCKDALY